MGYLNLGRGLRISGGGWGGKTDIISDIYGGDSSQVLQTHVGYGGFLVEKAFIHDRINFIVGGYLGGGNIKVSVKMIDMASIEWIDFEAEGEETNQIKANFMLTELHGAFTYTIVPFFHLGLNLSAPIFISTNGFAYPGVPYSSEFYTINPGLQLRVIFGNLG